MGDVVVNIRGRLDPSVARAMRGVSDEARKSERARRAEEKRTADDARAKARETAKTKIKAERDAAAAAKQTSREKARAEAEAARAASKGAADALRAVKRAEDEKRREAQKTTREVAKQAEAQARAVQRTNQRAFAHRLAESRTRQAATARAGARRQAGIDQGYDQMIGAGFSMAGGLAVGAVTASVAYAQQRQSQLQGWLGAQDSDAVLAMAGDLQLTLTRLATQGGRAKSQLDDFVKSMTDFGVPVTDSTQMLADAQNLFTNQVDNIIANQGTIGRASIALGASPSDVMKIGALGVRDMGIGQADYDEAIALAMASTDKGGVEAAGLGTYFQGGIGMAASTFHAQGLEGMRQWAVGAQLAPASGYDTQAEQAHSYENFMQRLSDPEIRANLARAGANITTGANGTGSLRSEIDVLKAMATAPGLRADGALQDILGDVNAARYAQGLQRAGTGRIDELYNSTTVDGGNALIGNTYDRTMSTQAGRNLVEQTQRQGMIFEQSESAYRTARRDTGYIQDYEARHATENPWRTKAVTMGASALSTFGSVADSVSGFFGGQPTHYEDMARSFSRRSMRDEPGGKGGPSQVTLAGTPTVELGPNSLSRLNQPAPATAGEGSSGARGASPAERAR